MSSWLSCVTDFCLNQEVTLSEENIIQNKIKTSFDSKLEKTNNKVKQEIKHFLDKTVSYLKNSYLKRPVVIKNAKIIQEKQKQALFGSSPLNLLKKGSQRTFKPSPLTLFSRLQNINHHTKPPTSTKIIYISQKLILAGSFQALNKNTGILLSYKFLVFQKTNQFSKNNVHQKDELISKENTLKKNEKSFLNNDQDQDKQQHQEQENNEDISEFTIVSTALKTTFQYIPSLIVPAFTKKYCINKPSPLQVDISHKEIQQQTIRSTPPKIPLPTIGIFALYYILTKQGIISDQTAYSTYKQEIETTHQEISQTYEKRLQIIRENIEKEQAMARWGVFGKFISWLMSFIAVVTACILIVSGIGAIMGAVILAAGLFSLTNSILEITNGWSKIGELLPIKNADARRKALGIIKMSAGIISLVLSIITIIWGGYSHALRALQSVTQAITGALTTGLGICIIGESVSAHSFYYGLADLKDTERNLEKLYFKRKDLMEKSSWDLDHLEKLFEDISYALDLHKETAMIDNSFYY